MEEAIGRESMSAKDVCWVDVRCGVWGMRGIRASLPRRGVDGLSTKYFVVRTLSPQATE